MISNSACSVKSSENDFVKGVSTISFWSYSQGWYEESEGTGFKAFCSSPGMPYNISLNICFLFSRSDFHAIDMLHLSYFPGDDSVDVVGNATLDGKLTHTLEGRNEQLNVSQLLPLEPSHLWTQRKSSLYLYLQQFQNMAKVIARERNVACE